MGKNKLDTHLLEVNGLYTSFNIPAGEVRSVNGVSFTLDKGKVLGIVGESGSGKSVTAYSIMQILQNPGRVVAGSIKFNGQELLGLTPRQLQKLRGNKISIIFQDPMSSLNPVYTIGNQMMEAINLHPVKRIVDQLEDDFKKSRAAYRVAKEKYSHIRSNDHLKKLNTAKTTYLLAKKKRNNYAYDRALEMLQLVGINEPAKRLKQYPFEFSGGMLQRIMIAMSLVCEPDLLIADEPTTALDVTIQAQILELLKDLQKKMNMGIIIITHDLGVVAQICDEVDVMYAGRIVERGTVEEIFYNPQHEYTKGLMKSIPQADDNKERLIPIEGNPVDVFCLPQGCSFAPRCASCMKICLLKYPFRVAVNKKHQTSCFKYVIDAYNKGKIKMSELKQIIDSSTLGNAAFKPISRFDVFDAKNDYKLVNRMYRHVALQLDVLEPEEVEQVQNRAREMKSNYIRAKQDLKISERNHRLSRQELPSMEKGDMARHIKEARTRVYYVDDLYASKKSLYNRLEKLSISSYSVDYKFHREDVAIAKQKYLDAKKELRNMSNNDPLAKTTAKFKVDEAKKEYENAQDVYARNRRITRKLLATREMLIKLNAKRVMKVIKKNTTEAYKEFKSKHLMFNDKKDLEKYLKGFVYAHWDFNHTITPEQIAKLKKDWDKKQAKIYEVREKGNNTNVDRLIKEKNTAMYRYWFNRSDLDIAKYYRKQKAKFESRIRLVNNINHNKTRIIYREGRAK